MELKSLIKKNKTALREIGGFFVALCHETFYILVYVHKIITIKTLALNKKFEQTIAIFRVNGSINFIFLKQNVL